jgi:hypothetical protein
MKVYRGKALRSKGILREFTPVFTSELAVFSLAWRRTVPRRYVA